MKKIRALIVDDVALVRRTVSRILSEEPDIEVVGTSSSGNLALQRIPQYNPDIITLDIEMPEMDGLETLRQIRASYPRLPVIMFSTLTDRGASATLDALSLGANDYVTKPSGAESKSDAEQQIRDQLLPKIRGLCGLITPPALQASQSPRRVVTNLESSRLRRGSPRRIDLVAIGVSTGGPNALAELIPKLPADFPVPILIVQHMPKIFTRLLAERLEAASELTVYEGVEGALIEPSSVLIAPGDYHMGARRAENDFRITLNQGPEENSCRPAVDPLFRSVVENYGAHCLAVVLTGMGYDGLRGCEAIDEAGGQIIVQDEASSVVWGMPGVVVENGLADEILPISEMAGEICRRVNQWRNPRQVEADIGRVVSS